MIVEGREHPASPSPYQWARPSPPAFEEGLWTRAQVGELPPSAGIDYVNVWTHILDRKYVSVFAGSRPDRPSDGLLFVEEIDPITWHHNFQSLSTPIVGPVEIERTDGALILLASQHDAEKTVFDVASVSFSPWTGTSSLS